MMLFNSARDAIRYSLGGEQALHVYSPSEALRGKSGVPLCFKRAKMWAHLFDQDEDRLIHTAARLGVRVMFVHRQHGKLQHIDLCGRPLRNAEDLCVEQEVGFS